MAEGNVIDAVCDRIKFDKERLEKNELGRIEVESFNLSEFWTQFGAAVQSLNNEVTKIGFMSGKKPFPKSGVMDSMIQDLLQYYTVMRDLYLVLPPDVGAELFKAVTSAVTSIMASLVDFLKSLHNLSEKGAKDRLTLTGTFWDACNAVDSLPKDNLQATLKVLENEVNLASDAQEELETVSTCAAIDKVNKDYEDSNKVSIMFVESKPSNLDPKLDTEKVPSTQSNSQFNKPKVASESNEALHESKATMFVLSENGDSDSKDLDETERTVSTTMIESSWLGRDSITSKNPDDILSELNTSRSVEEHVGESEFGRKICESLPSEFIVLDEIHDDDLDSTDDLESVSIISSPLNSDNVALEYEKGINKAEELSKKSEQKDIGSGTKYDKLNNLTSMSPSAILSQNIDKASFSPLYRKDVYLDDRVSDKRFNGSTKRRRKKYLEEVSKDLVKAFESNDSMKNMEAMVLNVPKSFIDNCDSFNISKVIDYVRDHNPTLDTQEWLVHTHWVGDAQQLIVLLLVDNKSLQSISTLDGQIYLSEDLKTGIRKFIPVTNRKLMSSVNCGNKTTVPLLKSISRTRGRKVKNTNPPFKSLPKRVSKTFVPDTDRPFLQHSIERNKTLMLRPGIGPINDLLSSESNKNRIGNKRNVNGEIRCEDLLKGRHNYKTPTMSFCDNYPSTKSEFSTQDYSLERPSKMRLSEKVSDDACQYKNRHKNSKEQSDLKYFKGRSFLSRHPSDPKHSRLRGKEGCSSRDNSSRDDFSRSDSSRPTSGRSHHQDIHDFYPPKSDFRN